MPFDRFMIAPINSGLQTDLRPWLIPDDAFQSMNNVYVFRGRIRKRFGSYLMNGSVSDSVAQQYSRLAINVGTTNGAGVLAGNVRTITTDAAMVTAVGQVFGDGTNFFTVVNPAGGVQNMIQTSAGGPSTFNLTTSDFALAGAAHNAPVYFYTGFPVMGLLTFQNGPITNWPLIAFDTTFSYQFINGHWQMITGATNPGDNIWTGGDTNFFFGCSAPGTNEFDNFFYVTNFFWNLGAPGTGDKIRYYDGTNWNTLTVTINAGGDTCLTSLMIFYFKGRLILLNTIENISGTTHQFPQRARFNDGASPLAANTWKQDINGYAGFIDASTEERIISAAYIRDRLIVFFERSTWELVFTNNDAQPFRWQRINQELGAESTFSVVPFDKVLLTISDVGVHSCNGAQVERIDQKIPDNIFQVSTDNSGPNRVYGIRDFQAEMVYWSFPSAQDDPVYPNQVLVYNYRNNTWAYNDDSITCFGYFQDQNGNATEPQIQWQDADLTWEEMSDPWNSGVLQSKVRMIVAGNQEGFVFVVNAGLDEGTNRNAPALQITNIAVNGTSVTLTIMNHNFTSSWIDSSSNADYILIENVQGTGTMTNLNGRILPIYSITDANNVVVLIAAITGAYTGGGTVTRISNTNFTTKQYNFYVDKGRNAFISKVDFLVAKTLTGQITVDFSTDTMPNQLSQGITTGGVIGTNILETSPYTNVPYEEYMTRLWHPLYFWADGECIQLSFYLSDDQLRNPDVALGGFELHAMTFYATPTASRLQ